jgi:C1q domain
MTNLINSNTAQNFNGISATISNVTGNGTVYTCIASTLLQGNGYNIANGIFTCTIPGLFLFSMRPQISNLSFAATLAVYKLVTTLKTYTFSTYSVGGWRSQASVGQFQGYLFVPMNAGDTAYTTVQVSNTTLTLGISSVSSFSAVRLF